MPDSERTAFLTALAAYVEKHGAIGLESLLFSGIIYTQKHKTTTLTKRYVAAWNATGEAIGDAAGSAVCTWAKSDAGAGGAGGAGGADTGADTGPMDHGGGGDSSRTSGGSGEADTGGTCGPGPSSDSGGCRGLVAADAAPTHDFSRSHV